MIERQEIKHFLMHECPSYAAEYPPANAMEMLDWLRRHLEEVPEEYRDKVVVEFGGGDSGDGIWVSVWYMRPETDEELHKRHAKAGMKKWE